LRHFDVGFTKISFFVTEVVTAVNFEEEDCGEPLVVDWGLTAAIIIHFTHSLD
jgi:hypothetical protein